MYLYTQTQTPLLIQFWQVLADCPHKVTSRLSHTAHSSSIHSCATPFLITAIRGCRVMYIYMTMGNLYKKIL